MNTLRAAWAASLCLLVACSPTPETADAPPGIPTGTWRGTLSLYEGRQTMPFNFEVRREPADTGAYVFYLVNGAERLPLREVRLRGDSVVVPMHIFDAQIVAAVRTDRLEGYYEKLDTEAPYRLPFAAEADVSYRFEPAVMAEPAAIAGKWRTYFLKDDGDSIPALGLFEQKDATLTGTFLTATGDYRYLAGSATETGLRLSTFDGSHAYLFKGTLQSDSVLKGKFWSGQTGYRRWVAYRDADAVPPEKQTALREGYQTLPFRLPNLNGDTVSSDDERFRDKVTIVQIFGSWCPNCMDETAFLAPWYAENHDRGVEVVGLAFERKPNFDYARQRVNKVVERYDVQYPFLIAGTTDPATHTTALPSLTAIESYPTTLWIGKDGRVRHIHTGFSGPGTGEYYQRWIEEFNVTTDALLAE